MARGLVGAAVLLVAAVTHVLAVLWFLLGTCAISDTAVRIPAPASPQGRLCDSTDHWLNVVPYVALGTSALVCVVLAVALWNDRRWRWLGLTACLWLPLVVSVGLAAPVDTCHAQQRAELPAYSCRTTPDG